MEAIYIVGGIIIAVVLVSFMIGDYGMRQPVQTWSDRDLEKRRVYFSNKASRQMNSQDFTPSGLEKARVLTAKVQEINEEINSREARSRVNPELTRALEKAYNESVADMEGRESEAER